MIRPRVFQALVILSVLLYPIYLFHYSIWLPGDSRVLELLQWWGYDALFVLPHWWFTIVMWAWLFAAIGMFFFQNWGRVLYVVLTLEGFVETLLGGITISTPAHMILLSTVNILDGMVLALAFFSPLRESFQPGVPSNHALDPDARKSARAG